MPSDIELAYTALSAKRINQDKLWAYFDGAQPLKYSSERLRDLFDAIDVRFIENWCSAIVNATLDRMELERFVVQGREDLTDTLNTVLKSTELDLDADDIHLGALVTGESYLLAWKEPREDGSAETEAYYHDPRMCHIQYQPDNPREKAWAAKWWEEEVPDAGSKSKKRIRINLYYPDRLEYYVSTKAPEHVQSGKDFIADAEKPPQTNPYNTVPVFHFRRERRKVIGELTPDILTLQDAVNKLLSDMMVSSEFAAVTQRWFVTNADAESLKNAANQNLIIPAGDKESDETTQVGQFKQADLSGFLSAIDNLASAMASISRTPKHYFLAAGGDPSGEALLTQEAPMNKKVKRIIRRSQNTWQRAGAFLLLLETGERIDPEDIDPVFTPSESVLPKTQADVRKLNVESGIPLKTTLRREGWTDPQLDQMDEDRAAEGAAGTESLGAALAARERAFNAGAVA